MKPSKWLLCIAALAGTAAQAASYNFDVNYFGGGVATLAAGSDDPVNQTLVDGDSFNWSISAQNNDRWLVETGNPQGFFPLMAFGTMEDAVRTGDFTLTLKNNGSAVFTLVETASRQNFVHIGTNEVVLGTGLEFDQMQLSYTLTSAVSELDPSVSVNSTLTGLLPIFGAPEQNVFEPGIIYGPVPEPGTYLLLLAGLAGVGWVARQRRA
jgi:PEP-CTERM motif